MNLALIGSVMMSFCALPQVLLCIKQKHADGVSLNTLMLWHFASILLAGHTFGSDWYLFGNYTINVAFTSIILYYKFKVKRGYKRNNTHT